MTSLFHLATELANLEELMNNPDREAELIALIQRKVDNCAEYMNRIDDYVDAIDKRIKELEQYADNAQKKKESFRKYLKLAIDQLGVDELSGEIHTIKFRKPSKVCVIDDQTLLPAKYKAVETIVKVDKISLKKDLEKEAIEGAHLEEGKSSLIIKGAL